MVYEFLIDIARTKNILDDELYALTNNTIPEKLLEQISIENCDSGSAKYLLNMQLLEKLIKRLQRGQYLSNKFSVKNFKQDFKVNFDENKLPFFSKELINAHAAKIRDKMMHALALQRMPSEADVAHEVVLYLANTNVTGETLYPSCGLSLDRFVTATQWMPNATVNKNKMLDKTVMIFGGAFFEEISAAACDFIISGAKKIIIIVRSDNDIVILKDMIAKKSHLNKINFSESIVLSSLGATDTITSIKSLVTTIDKYISEYGNPAVMISFPMSDIKNKIQNELPSLQCFEELMLEHVTNNFIVAQRACLIDNCCMIAVTQGGIQRNMHQVTASFDAFFKGVLRTFTATVGKEGSLLSHKPCIYQVEPSGDIDKLISVIVGLASTHENTENYNSGMIFTV